MAAVLDVVGFMYFWSLNIDSVTVIMLVIALGLSVDYSAHLGHTFMHKQGTNDDRMVETMADIGVAVFNGEKQKYRKKEAVGRLHTMAHTVRPGPDEKVANPTWGFGWGR